jgi:hypothetical protein
MICDDGARMERFEIKMLAEKDTRLRVIKFRKITVKRRGWRPASITPGENPGDDGRRSPERPVRHPDVFKEIRGRDRRCLGWRYKRQTMLPAKSHPLPTDHRKITDPIRTTVA